MAHETDILLGGEAFIDRIVREDGSFAEKIVSRVLSLDKAFAKLGDKESKAQHKLVREAERLYLKAAEAAGNGTLKKMILAQVPELEEELMGVNEEKMQVSEKEVQLNLNEDLGEQLQDWLNGGGKQNGRYNGSYFELGTTPDILIKHGAKPAPVIMYEDCVAKVTGLKGDQAHMISLDEIAKLPSQLNDPILLFKGKYENTFVALTEIVDKYGNDVIAAIHIKKGIERTTITKIASLYSKTNDYGENRIINYVNEQIRKGNLLDASTKKAPNWFTIRGLRLPKTVQTILDANNSIAQNPEKSTETEKKVSTDGKVVQMSLAEDANQQTSDDIDELMRSAGIEGDAVEIREDLAELYRKAENLATDEDATSGKSFVERVANRIALNMAQLGTVRDGETQETMAERLREEILSRSAFAEQETEAPQEAPKETPKDEPKPKKTGYTYDDVHGMMDAVKRGLKFETAGTERPKGNHIPIRAFLYAKLYKMQILYN